MRYPLIVCAIVAIALFAFVRSGAADPPDLLLTVPPHQHFILTPTGEMVAVGPQICDNPDLQQAFNEFHFNVHHSQIPGIGVIHTLGPQNGAPGLSNALGAELVVVRGCP
jgi:hypothetical protein